MTSPLSPSWRALAGACGLFFCWTAQTWAAPPAGLVKGVRRDLVYVDLGRAQGVRPGDVLTIAGSEARLEVVQLGEKQLAGKKVGSGEVRVGDRVASPREPAEARQKRPVVVLPAPRSMPTPLPWQGAPPHRTALVGSPAVAPEPVQKGARGEIRVSYVGLLDQGTNNLDLHQAEVRSKLAIDLGSGLQYRHDLAGRLELGPALAERHGSDSRPYYRARLLELRWRSKGYGDAPEDRPAGAFEAAIGRQLWSAPSFGLVDGLRADLALGCGFSAGLVGGLAPALLDTAVSSDMAVVGGHASWFQTGEIWQARASLTTTTSFWRGAMNRLDVAATGSLARGRDLDLYALVVGTLVDALVLPDTQNTMSLSRGFFGTRLRLADWLTLDAHYAHEQFVGDRETMAALGVDRLVTDPRESAWLQVRLDVVPDVTLSLSGTMGFGSASADYQGAAARLALRNVFGPELRLALNYQLGFSPATETHNPSIDINLALGRVVELALGYGFATFRSRLLDERQDEHRIDAGVDLLLAGPWRINLRGSFAFGTQASQVAIMGQLAWRFR